MNNEVRDIRVALAGKEQDSEGLLNTSKTMRGRLPMAGRKERTGGKDAFGVKLSANTSKKGLTIASAKVQSCSSPLAILQTSVPPFTQADSGFWASLSLRCTLGESSQNTQSFLERYFIFFLCLIF